MTRWDQAISFKDKGVNSCHTHKSGVCPAVHILKSLKTVEMITRLEIITKPIHQSRISRVCYLFLSSKISFIQDDVKILCL